jgi:hypothetical protein
MVVALCGQNMREADVRDRVKKVEAIQNRSACASQHLDARLGLGNGVAWNFPK